MEELYVKRSDVIEALSEVAKQYLMDGTPQGIAGAGCTAANIAVIEEIPTYLLRAGEDDD